MSRIRFARGPLAAIIGAVYGAVLFAFAFRAAGFGHGSYLPFAVFGAPLSLLHGWLAIAGPLILWPAFGWILGSARGRLWPALFLAMHALAAGSTLISGNPFETSSEQWEYLARAQRSVGGSITTGFVVYAFGQIVAWGVVLMRRRNPDEPRLELPDPDLGGLTFEDGYWRAGATAGGIPLLIRANRRGPDTQLRETGRDAIQQLPLTEPRAREYLATAAAKPQPLAALTLSVVEVLRPDAEWVRNQIAPESPGAAETILRGAPIVVLQFQIAGDLNVVEAMLLDGVPVGWDYH